MNNQYVIHFHYRIIISDSWKIISKFREEFMNYFSALNIFTEWKQNYAMLTETFTRFPLVWNFVFDITKIFSPFLSVVVKWVVWPISAIQDLGWFDISLFEIIFYGVKNIFNNLVVSIFWSCTTSSRRRTIKTSRCNSKVFYFTYI